MSTLSISPAFTAGTIARPQFVERLSVGADQVRLTRRGRLVFLAAFLGLAFAIMIAFGGWATATHDAGAPGATRVVDVQPGDTLYGFAAKIAKPGKIREMVHQIQELNSLPSGGLQVGQKLSLPVQ